MTQNLEGSSVFPPVREWTQKINVLRDGINIEYTFKTSRATIRRQNLLRKMLDIMNYRVFNNWPSQAKPSQAKPSQAKPSQAKPSQ